MLMKKLASAISLVLIALLLVGTSAFLGAAWFGLWMDKGWPGATGILVKLLNADGEYAYDAMQLEMTLWCLVIMTCILIFISRWRKIRKA
jgi:hypothetical protein